MMSKANDCQYLEAVLPMCFSTSDLSLESISLHGFSMAFIVYSSVTQPVAETHDMLHKAPN